MTLYLRSLSVALLACSAATLCAQGKIFDKSYQVGGHAALELHADDADVRTTSCGNCSSIHIHLDYRDADPSRYNVIESQSGSSVTFQLKHKVGFNWSSNWSHGPEITVEVPGGTDDRITSGSGNVSLRGVHGQQELHSGSGNVTAEEIAGSLRADTGSGEVQARGIRGDFEGHTGSGNIDANGTLTLHRAGTGSGEIRLSMAPGSTFANDAVIQTGSGDVELRLPSSARADLQASTGSGDIHCDLPISGGSHNDHSLSGALNGGGPSVRIRTGSGSIALRGN